MKRFFLITVMLVLAVSMAHGRWVTAKGNWDVPFVKATEKIANDFHIEGTVLSRDNQMPQLQQWWVSDSAGNSWWVNNYNIVQDPNNPIVWNFSLNFITNGYVSIGQMIHFGFYFTVDMCNDIFIRDAFWTLNGKRISASIPLGGFSISLLPQNGFSGQGGKSFVQEGVFSDIVEMRNDMKDTEIILRDVEFAITDQQIPLPQMGAEGLGVPGSRGSEEFNYIEWRRFEEPIHLKPGESFKIDLNTLGLTKLPNTFLQIRAFSEIGGESSLRSKTNSINVMPAWWQHED